MESSNILKIKISKTIGFFKKIICWNESKNDSKFILSKSSLQILIIFFILLFLFNILNIYLYLDLKIITKPNLSNKQFNEKNDLNIKFEKSMNAKKIKDHIKFLQNNENDKKNIYFENKKFLTIICLLIVKFLFILGFSINYFIKLNKIKNNIYNEETFSYSKSSNIEKECLNYLDKHNVIRDYKNTKFFRNIKKNNLIFSNQESINSKSKDIGSSIGIDKVKSKNIHNKMEIKDYLFSNHNMTNEALIRKDFLNAKISLLNTLSFFNYFDISFQFFIFIYWIKNFVSNKPDIDDLNLIFFYASIFYISILIFYFSFIDRNYYYYLISNIISLILFQIFEILVLKNKLYNSLIMIVFIIITFFVNRQTYLDNLLLFLNQIDPGIKIKKEENCENIDNGILIVDLNLDGNITNNKKFDYIFENFILSKSRSDPNRSKKNKNNILIEDDLNYLINNKEKIFVKERLRDHDYREKYLINEKSLYDNTKVKKRISEISFKKKELSNINILNKSNKSINSNTSNDRKIMEEIKKININEINDKRVDLPYILNFLLNQKKIIQLIYEIDDFNFNLNEEIISCYLNLVNNLQSIKEKKFDKFFQIFTNKNINMVKKNFNKKNKSNFSPNYDNISMININNNKEIESKHTHNYNDDSKCILNEYDINIKNPILLNRQKSNKKKINLNENIIENKKFKNEEYFLIVFNAFNFDMKLLSSMNL